MKNSVELLPCPFCGATARLNSIDEDLNYVSCTRCHSMSVVDTVEVTTSIWNSRVNKISVGNGENYEVTRNTKI